MRTRIILMAAAALAWGQEPSKTPAQAAQAPEGKADKVEAAANATEKKKPRVPRPAKGDLAQVTSVYLMKMGMGLDQYLSQRLVEKGVVTVVTDPLLADAFFTDHLGSSFEGEFQRLIENPDESSGTESSKERSDRMWEATRSTFGRGRGNVFLVDRASGAVLWSIYERPKSGQPAELNKTAGKIAGALQDRIKRVSKPVRAGKSSPVQP